MATSWETRKTFFVCCAVSPARLSLSIPNLLCFALWPDLVSNLSLCDQKMYFCPLVTLSQMWFGHWALQFKKKQKTASCTCAHCLRSPQLYCLIYLLLPTVMLSLSPHSKMFFIFCARLRSSAAGSYCCCVIFSVGCCWPRVFSVVCYKSPLTTLHMCPSATYCHIAFVSLFWTNNMPLGVLVVYPKFSATSAFSVLRFVPTHLSIIVCLSQLPITVNGKSLFFLSAIEWLFSHCGVWSVKEVSDK